LKSQKPTTIKQLCEWIGHLEEKYSLLEYEQHGVKVWQYARMNIYYMLANKLDILDEPQVRMSRSQKILYLGRYIKNALLSNPFGASSAEVMIFPHPRVKEVDGRYIDIYTNDIEEELLSNKVPFIEIESPYRGEHRRPKAPYIVYDDMLVLVRKLVGAVPFLYTVHDPRLDTLQEEIREQTGIAIDLSRLFSRYVRTFKTDYFFYTQLLRKIKPKQIFLTVSYGKGALIHAAREMEIETVEIQHGTFSRYHLGYYFGEKKGLEYFPDRFWVWSDFWRDLIPLPIEKEHVDVHGFAYMQRQKERYAHTVKNHRQIVVLSQGAIGEEIAGVILRNMAHFQGFEIKYKLHPGEYDRYNTYPSLVKLLEYDTVTLVKECDLYALLAQSYYQIGVFSTAIYEGIEMGCRTVLLDITGIEYMEDLLEQNKASRYKEGTPIHVY